MQDKIEQMTKDHKIILSELREENKSLKEKIKTSTSSKGDTDSLKQ